MSDSLNGKPSVRRERDGGMTLPELLIAISVLGIIAAVLSSAIIVTYRQQDNTMGRVNVARAEQSVSLYLPADLASADTVDTSPSASPCGASVCDGIDLSKGSNVLMLTWTTNVNGTEVTTNVSYHFTPSASDPETYELWRVECIGGNCTSQVVLKDLPGPPGGETFVPGVPNGAGCTPTGTVPCTRPNWVIIVSEPLRADATSEDDVLDPEASASEKKSANRVIVTINGGGDAEGAGGGINQISITAGGTTRTTIPASSTQGTPSFSEALSLCGGPMVLVIDESNSIGDTAILDVRAGVKTFIETLAGTPVRLQVVRFHTYSQILASGQWHEYFDMTDTNDVNTLLAAVDDLKGNWNNVSNAPYRSGGTNWEEALYRTFYNADGSTASVIPETVVFFTDGVPTFDRLVFKSDPGVIPADPPAPVAPWPASTGSAYSQVGFNRANYIANAFRRSVRFIGVGVGPDISKNSSWIVDPGAGFRTVYERGYRQYQREASRTYESNIDFEQANGYESNQDFEQATVIQSNLDFEQASTYQSIQDFEKATSWTSNIDFEQKVSGNWQDRTPTQYYTNNTTPDSTDNWRINSTTRTTYPVTQTEFVNYRGTNTTNWGLGGWTDQTPTQYYASNTTSDSWDGWRINGNRSNWYTVTQAEYTAYANLSVNNWSIGGWQDRTPTQYYGGNTTGDSTDGWRIDGTRTTYNVTALEYKNWASLNPSNWSIGSWQDRTPTQYYAGNTTADSSDSWRINGVRSSWYTVTTAENTSYSALSPSNWRRAWADVMPAQYFAGNTAPDETDGWRVNPTPRSTWYTVPQSDHDANNTTPDDTDGWRYRPNYVWITKAEFDAPGNNTAPDASDGYVDVGAPQYVTAADAQDWVVWTDARPNDGTFRSKKVYNSPPYEAFEPATTVSAKNSVILARLIAGNDYGTPASPTGGPYTNAAIADMYVLPNWNQFQPALKAVALGECGGTLTMQTKMTNGTAAPDPFKYQRSNVIDADGNPVVGAEASYVQTNQQFTTGTFDMPIPDGRYVTVEIRPQNYSQLTNYTPGAWTCKAGVTARTFTLIDIPDTNWKGIRLQVAANEAVSCTLTVSR